MHFGPRAAGERAACPAEIARDALGDAPAARRALEQALDQAEHERLLFPFLYDPAPGLLDRHRRHGTAPGGLIAEILNVLAGRSPAHSRPDRNGCASRSATPRPGSCATCPPSCRPRRSPTSCTCR